MKLSILILTHNRPKLFKRCIESILACKVPPGVEVIVNNDSNDIDEIYNTAIPISYYYKRDSDLSNLYRFLFDRSLCEFVYFLEDDDYIKRNFFDNLDFESDVNYLEYVSEPLIAEIGPYCAYKRVVKSNRHLFEVTDLSKFLREYTPRDFQLGQILFRKSLIKSFPVGNNINNDIELFHSLQPATIKYIIGERWVQTTSGSDNISFHTYNKDDRFYQAI